MTQEWIARRSGSHCKKMLHTQTATGSRKQPPLKKWRSAYYNTVLQNKRTHGPPGRCSAADQGISTPPCGVLAAAAHQELGGARQEQFAQGGMQYSTTKICSTK